MDLSEGAAVLPGHSHGEHRPDPANPAHRVLGWLYDSTHITPLAGWLESSLFSSVAKVLLFMVAALAAWLAGRGGVQAAALAGLSQAATAGVYFFAGVPAAVGLSYDVTAGIVDTDVLMNLAVVGTLATGYLLEVWQGACWCLRPALACAPAL